MTVWDDLVGQSQAVQTLQAAAQHARAIVEGAQGAEGDGARGMTHSWLITGPPGSGRSTAARAFAAALQCTGEPVGCGQCPGCKSTLARSNGDVADVVTTKVIISIEEVRDLVYQSQSAPSRGRWRVILIEDADRMMERASNVLLKAIEEPPERTVWLLCAPSPEDMITTIRSRCRHVSLRIPPAGVVAELLQRQFDVPPERAVAAARLAQSHIGRAKGLLSDDGKIREYQELMQLALSARSTGEAVLNAGKLISRATEIEKKQQEKDFEKAESALRRTLGIEEGEAPPSHMKHHFTRLKEDQDRQATRMQRDALDRVMLDLLAFYRDVLARQLGAQVGEINVGLSGAVQNYAQMTSPQQTLEAIESVELARSRLQTNTTPLLIVEAMLTALVPHR
ncbi:MAG: DNA polymerase III subunit delta' [Actinomycetaceae bacterium]|nr:DNA polymerase III subunit delta' [Actinomycetaceae bacterium]